LALLSIFQPFGVVICSVIASGFILQHSCEIGLPSCYDPTLALGAACCTKADNHGWRYLVFTLGGITLFVFVLRFAIFTFQESPKFLFGKGKDGEALKIL
jgi:MFS family permease